MAEVSRKEMIEAARDHLNIIKENRKEIELIEEQISDIKSFLYEARGSHISTTKTKGSFRTDAMEDAVLSSVMMEKKLERSKAKLQKNILAMIAQLEEVPDVTQRKILYMWHAKGTHAFDIGAEMGYSFSSVYRIYKDGLQEYYRIFLAKQDQHSDDGEETEEAKE